MKFMISTFATQSDYDAMGGRGRRRRVVATAEFGRRSVRSCRRSTRNCSTRANWWRPGA